MDWVTLHFRQSSYHFLCLYFSYYCSLVSLTLAFLLQLHCRIYPSYPQFSEENFTLQFSAVLTFLMDSSFHDWLFLGHPTFQNRDQFLYYQCLFRLIPLTAFQCFVKLRYVACWTRRSLYSQKVFMLLNKTSTIFQIHSSLTQILGINHHSTI